MELVQHPFHDQHPLVLLIISEENHYEEEEEHYTCSACTLPVDPSGPVFICCQKCGFILHKSCAELPMQITHFSHTNHPLALSEKCPYESKYCLCDRCNDKIEEGFVYHCSICKYDLDISCASMSFEEADKQLVHPFHKHPLMPSEHTYDEKQLFCSGCAAPILPGPIFVCSKQKQQCKFVLHKSCAELRKEITHFSHTQHHLTLLEKSPYEDGIGSCDRCKDDTNVFVYHCSICKYDLDVMCASLRSNYVVYEEDHEHRFIMVKPAPFTCDICGEESKDKQSYICITCQEHIHPACSSLPRRVKLFTHRCPLQLTFGHQLEKPIDPIRQYSRTCFEKIDTKYAFYYCVDCEYIADIECTRSETFRDYKFDVEANTAVRFKDEGKIDLQTWHDHGLILRSDAYEPKTDTRDQVACFGCLSVISSSAPFYECQEKCGYTLHESCANLYENFRHPFHPDHDLVLLDEGNFYCDFCGQPCSGFGYYCKQEGCESPVVFDIKCALRSDVIHIEGAHPHPLRIIMKGEHNEKTCKGCSRGCYSARYSCIEPKCDYNVCDECVGLPTSAKHRWDEHPVELTYESTPRHEKDGGEYYCDECEEPREKDHWFYHCATCERDVHPKCAVLHNLDSRRTYTIEDIHPGHELIIVANPQVYPTCSNCGLPCKDLYFQCLDCKYYKHFRCPSDVESDDGFGIERLWEPSPEHQAAAYETQA